MTDTSKGEIAAEIRKLVAETHREDGAPHARTAFKVLESLDLSDPDVLARAKIAHADLSKQIRHDLKGIGQTQAAFCELVTWLCRFLDGDYNFVSGQWLTPAEQYEQVVGSPPPSPA